MKFWKILKQFKTTFFVLFFLSLILKPNFVMASNKFLTLPFATNPALMQGWNYNFGSRTHQGIDYYAVVGTDLVATADGTVKKYFQSGSNFVYGNFIVIDHGNGYRTLCAHLSEVLVSDGSSIKRGQVIARTGISGTDNPHLHFESLTSTANNKGPNRGYGWRIDSYDLYTTANSYPPNSGYKVLGSEHLWMNDYPSVYIPPKPSTLSIISTEPNKFNLSWTKSEDTQFAKYEIYRSTVQNGTDDSNQRTLVFQSTNVNILSATDSNAPGGNTYYYRIFTYFKNGMVAQSDEVSIEIKRVVEKITDGDSSTQHFPVIDNGKIFWEDLRSENNGYPRKLYFYDLATKKTDSVNIGIDGTQRPLSPNASGGRVVYYAYDNKGTDRNVYCYDFNTGNAYAITQAAKGQYSPVISDDGIVVWSDLRNGNTNSDLYYLDIKKSEGERVLVSERYNQIAPRIWKNKVVWKDSRVGNRYDLYTKEIGGTTETILATNTGSDPADVWENWATWTYSGKLSLMNMDTKEIKVIRASGAGTPRIKDGKVVYEFSEGAGVSYIHVYDIATTTDLKIDFPLYYNSSPFVSGNVLVFDASDKQTPLNFEIYLTYL